MIFYCCSPNETMESMEHKTWREKKSEIENKVNFFTILGGPYIETIV